MRKARSIRPHLNQKRRRANVAGLPSRPTGALPDGTYRAGFVSFVGRPNVGKSTLTNALVGEKVAITSPKPQTTRRAIRGVVSRPEGQIIIVDTPGMHRPRTLLGERLNAAVAQTLADVDLIAACFPATEPIGPGDRFLVDQLERFSHAKKVALITKTDLSKPLQIARAVADVTSLAEWESVIPVSALTGDQVDRVATALCALLPPSSDPLYPVDQRTDATLDERISELVREAALDGVHDELPHSIVVAVDEMSQRAGSSITDVYVSLYVERDSQKGIIIGAKAARLKMVGQKARASIEVLIGGKVYLSIQVKVAKEWQRDPKALNRFGF